MVKKIEYPWYEAVTDDSLEQGDLLPNCPVIRQPSNLSELLLNYDSSEPLVEPVTVDTVDLIIMSQSCDLQQDKIEQVLLCGYFPASKESKDNRKHIRKERIPSRHMIEKSSIAGHKFGQQIVDFRTIYGLPKLFVRAFATSFESRLRLLPPYKEHLSQAFARYFMRVGLPRPLEDE